MELPNDVTILLSYINTQLRDFYSDLDDLCQSLQLNQQTILEKLANIDYEYDAKTNQFI